MRLGERVASEAAASAQLHGGADGEHSARCLLGIGHPCDGCRCAPDDAHRVAQVRALHGRWVSFLLCFLPETWLNLFLSLIIAKRCRFGVFAQLVRIVNIATKTNDRFQAQVMLGVESPFPVSFCSV